MLHRRDAMMRLGQIGLGAMSLPGLLAAESQAGTTGRPKAKSCILLFLWGGPSQPDMWDLKPDAPEGIRSPFKSIHTNVPGIQICDQMPFRRGWRTNTRSSGRCPTRTTTTSRRSITP